MEKHGMLTILDLNRDENEKVLCRCDCGVEKMITIYNVRSGNTRSCGCFKKLKMKEVMRKLSTGKKPVNFMDYTGRKIGMITVLERIKDRRPHTSTYRCQCECGTIFETEISNLRRSKWDLCNCGFRNHPLKNRLQRMIDRCYDPGDQSYRYYGAKGIRVCDEWRKFPIRFIEWALANGWESNLTIDRIDSDKDYCPENCHWITLSQNSKKAMKKRWHKHPEYALEV